MAELADAQASGACGRKVVEVQILSSAPLDSAASRPRSWQALGRFAASLVAGRVADAHFEFILQTMLSWSPDGKLLAYSDKGPSGQVGIFLLDVVTLKTDWRGSPSADCITSWVPAFSPDGTSLAVGCMVTQYVNDLFVLPAAGGPGRRVARVQGAFMGMTWAADRRSLFYGVDGDLWRVAASSAQSKKLLTGRDVAMPAISQDGHRLAYTTWSFYTVNLWQVALSATNRSAGPPVELVSSSRTHGRPSFSPDGSRLAFESDRSGTPEVWTSDADGSNAVPLTAFGGPLTGSAKWSPDGHSIALDSKAEGRSSIYVVRSEGGGLHRVPTGVDESREPAWSIDGKWLFFTGLIEGAEQIFKVPIEGGQSTRLTKRGGYAPRAPSDDGRIYYSRDQEIWSVSPAGGDERRLVGIPRRPVDFNDSWGLSAAGIYFINPDPPRPGIDFFAFGSARIVRIVDLRGTRCAGEERWRSHRTADGWFTRSSMALPATSCWWTTSADPDRPTG